MTESVQYNLDLLTSFDARSNGSGLMSTADGLRRLQQLVRDQTINSVVRVKLHVEPSFVVITDVATGDEMEHIPVGLVYQPVVSIGDRSLAPYDNIVVFTVLEDSFQMAPPEMYFFQCLGCPAQDVVNALKAAKGGQLQHRKSSAAPKNGPGPRINKMQEYNDQAQRSALAASTYKPGRAAGEIFRQSVNHDNNTSERTSHNIKLLDHCLDDIEKFVLRLQQAAEAFAKLEQRRNERQGGVDVVGPGDGMLMMRARPPPAQDFVTIFQKFKLAINLLSSLKGHIHNPNAPEMIHYLFKPLAMVVDSIRDPTTGSPTLATKVLHPLLTAESIQLLIDCLSTRESQLWESLGETWTRSRDQWPGTIPAYVPVFSDGWSPPAYWIDDGANEPLHRTSLQPEEAAISRVDRRLSPNVPDSKPSDSDRTRRSTAIYPISEITGVVDEKQQKFVWDLLARGAKIYLLVEAYIAGNAKELTVRKGEVIEVLDDSRNWWSVRNSFDEIGFVPSTILKPYTSNDRSYSPRDRLPSPTDQRQLYPNDSRSSSTTSTPPPPIAPLAPVVMRTSSVQPADRRSVPYMAEPPVASARNSYSDPRNSYENPPVVSPRSRTSDAHRNVYSERPSLVVAPAFGYQEPPISQRQSVTAVDDVYDDTFENGNKAIVHPRTAVDDLNDEFRRKISGAEAIRPKPVAQQVAYIAQDSTNEDICNWLQSKGFSYNVLQQLSTYDGKKLFSLPKAKLEIMFGPDEGGRLNSQILVQRNLSGFKTARSSELQAILKNRKMKLDTPSRNGDTAAETHW